MTSLWAIQTGDCLEAVAQQKPGIARLIFADPPYNQRIDYGQGTKADALPRERYLGWCRRWMQLCYDVLAPDGSFWVLINDEWADEFGCMLRAVGLHRRSWIKWYESFGNNCTKKFNRCSRHLFHMVKDRKRFVFHPEAISRLSDRIVKYRDKRGKGPKLWDDVWIIPRLAGKHRERIKGFPTQLPIKLLRPIVGCASDPGDLIVDPFSGSATMGHAAIETGRRYLGVELNPAFAARSRERLRNVQGMLPFGTHSAIGAALELPT
jgi:site-specific DNA-methyltransferase (adenine-specific)